MKKPLLIVLTLAMLLSLCACGGGNDTPTSNVDDTPPATENPVEETPADDSETTDILEIGEVASTDKVEFVLKNFSFGKYYANDPAEFAIVDCSIKNIGKTTLDDMAKFSDDKGGTRLIRGIMRLNYDDGYIFNESLYNPYWDYEPLSPAVEHTVAYTVPAEVIENTDKSLLLEVVLPNEDGTMTIFTYKLR